MKSPAAATKGEGARQRGPSVMERRATEEQAGLAPACSKEPDFEAQELRQNKVAAKSSTGTPTKDAAVVDASLPNGVGIQGRGRAAMNGPLKNEKNSLPALQERRQSLLAAADFVLKVAPAGAGMFDGFPDRNDYSAGAVGELQFARDVEQFVEDNFDGKGNELRTLDQHELKSASLQRGMNVAAMAGCN
eukprot:CAMPEP_0119303648 /NCGR_PEP_ID=MMETSP1333-20130426/5050_1 /TAXON_ID=418940 /ORGANISM="Scyphosphaera apsteinii, Strain RCC1455" /LENGTH=189 /DNA_ID=CAMNT_0007306379 /DNA_START=84 /DNA_END=655 /DNA_ORIENTATION=-